jgi:PhnB protein
MYYASVNAFVIVDGAAELIAFLSEVFDGVETERISLHDGRIGHAEVRVGKSIVMLTDASERFPARTCALYVYVDDVDDTYRRALAAAASSIAEPENKFYGNREAGVIDPFGNLWWIATLKEEVDADELQRRWQVMNADGDR